MPQAKAERLAESLWRRHKPDIVAALEMALAEADGHDGGPAGMDPNDAATRYVEERATTQVARYLGKAARRRKATP